MSRQHHVTALEVLLNDQEPFHCPGPNTFIWTTTHKYMHTQTCDVFHWFCSGRLIHLISLLSSWTGLSICQPQSFLSKSIKLSCRINSAFLSSFPFGFTESLKSDGKKRFVVLVSFLSRTFEVTCLLWQQSLRSFCLFLSLTASFDISEIPEEENNVFSIWQKNSRWFRTTCYGLGLADMAEIINIRMNFFHCW